MPETAKYIKTGKDLISYIKACGLEDAPVYVGCQGFTNYDSLPTEQDTFAEMLTAGDERLLFISDNCVYGIEGKEV